MTIDFTAYFTRAKAEEQAKAQAAADAQAEAKRLAESQQEAEARAAAAAQRVKNGSRELVTALRELTDEVAQARLTAIEAVKNGEGAIDAWVQYRLTRARCYGRWQPMKWEYANTAGVRYGPPGSWGPVLYAGGWDRDMGGSVEGFLDFLHSVVSEAEQQLVDQGTAEVMEQLERARDSVEHDDTGPEAA